MKSTFYDSANILLDRRQAATDAHPLDLGDGRRVRSTTVLCVRRGDSVVMAADGQVTLGASVMKASAKKIRRLYQDKVLGGFAGASAGARTGADREYGAERAGDCGEESEDRGADLYLYKRPVDD